MCIFFVTEDLPKQIKLKLFSSNYCDKQKILPMNVITLVFVIPTFSICICLFIYLVSLILTVGFIVP